MTGLPWCQWKVEPWLAETTPSGSGLKGPSRVGKRSLWAAATGSPTCPRRKRRGVPASTDPEPEAPKDILAADDAKSPRWRAAPECLEDPRQHCIVLQLQNAAASSLFGGLARGKVDHAHANSHHHAPMSEVIRHIKCNGEAQSRV